MRKRRAIKPKVSRRKEIIKIRAEINEIEMKKLIAKINETKSWYFEKIIKIDRTLTGFIKEKREWTQISKIWNEKGDVITDTTEIGRIINDYYKQLQSMESSSPESWSGELFPSPGDLPTPGIKPRFPALQADSLPAETPGKQRR